MHLSVGDTADACGRRVMGLGVSESGCTCRSGETTDACSEIAIWMGVRETGCTYRSGETTDACGQMAVWMGVCEIGCTYRSGETADACGGEVGCSWLVLVCVGMCWRGGEGVRWQWDRVMWFV